MEAYVQAQRRRPLGITILAILAGAAFIVNVIMTILFIGALPVVLFGQNGFFGQALLGTLLWEILALVWGWVAVGLWNLSLPAWEFVVILASLNLIVAGVSLLGAGTWQVVLPSVIINASILVYCLSPPVKEAFGPLPPSG
jgi:hypothetical protein